MPKDGQETQAVRPLADHPTGRREHTPPRVAVGVAVLTIGGLLGWAAASLGSTSPTTTAPPQQQLSTATTVVPRYTGPEPSVIWTAAATVPPVPTGMEYGGPSEVAELDGRMYLIVSFYAPESDEMTSQIWQSEDGLEWDSAALAVGDGAAGYELTSAGDTLLLAGQQDERFAMWRSVPGRAIDGSSWIRIELDVPENLSRSFLTTAVNSRGEIVTVLIGNLEIWRDIIEPYVPDGVDLGDQRYVLRSDGVLFDTSTVDGVDFAETVPLFREPPQVVATRDTVWIRMVTEDGEEVLRAVEMPPGAYPVSNSPTLAEIAVALAWISEDASEFIPVTGRNALPAGYFLPEPWGDQFVTAAYELEDSFATNEQVTLWASGSGRAWEPEIPQPPADCSPFFFVTSGNRMHLMSEEGIQCVRDLGTEWEILAEPSTATYVVGGPAGFIGYPDSFQYDSALFSRDGISWVNIEVPGSEPYPTLSILRNRLLALSANRPRPNEPTQIDIWLGEIK